MKGVHGTSAALRRANLSLWSLTPSALKSVDIYCCRCLDQVICVCVFFSCVAENRFVVFVSCQNAGGSVSTLSFFSSFLSGDCCSSEIFCNRFSCLWALRRHFSLARASFIIR